MRAALRKRISKWFATPWRVVPAQAVIYTFLFIAAVHVIVTTSNEQIGFREAGLGAATYYWWNVLILLGPAMTGVAYLLIRHASGHLTVWGLWLRLGGDLSVLATLTALIATWIMVLTDVGPLGDSPLFALIALSGLTVFTGMLVVRDIGALIVLERIANVIHRRESL
jgi:hypothetical protein